MNPAVEKLVHFQSGSMTSHYLHIETPTFDSRRKTGSWEHSKIRAWPVSNYRLHFLFSVWTIGGECFLLRYSVQSNARANACWCTVGQLQPSHVTAPSILSLFHLLRICRPFHRQISVPIYWDVVSTALCRSFSAAEMDTWIFRSFVA